MTGLLAGLGLGWFAKWLHGALKLKPNQLKGANAAEAQIVTQGAAQAETALDGAAESAATKFANLK